MMLSALKTEERTIADFVTMMIRRKLLKVLVVSLLATGRFRCDFTVFSTAKLDTIDQKSTLPSWRDRETTINDDQSIIDAYQRALPCVAHIQAYKPISIKPKWKKWLRKLHQTPRGSVEVELSGSSGILWDDQGHVVATHHSCHNSQGQKLLRVEVTLPGIPYHVNAELVGSDSHHDIAVLKIIPEHLNHLKDESIELPRPLDMGMSKDLQVGQMCLAIGHPSGLPGTLTHGVISSLDRDVAVTDDGFVIYGCIQSNGTCTAYSKPNCSGLVSFYFFVPDPFHLSTLVTKL